MHLIESALYLFILPITLYVIYWYTKLSEVASKAYNDANPNYIYISMESTTMSPSLTFEYVSKNETNIGLLKHFFAQHSLSSYVQTAPATSSIDFKTMDHETIQKVVGLLLEERSQQYPIFSTKHYIDFSKASWEKDYHALVNNFYSQYDRKDFSPYVQMFNNDGYSSVISYPHYGFATNVCYNILSRTIIFYDDNSTSIAKYLEDNHMSKFFHHNNVKVINGTMPKDMPLFKDLGMVIARPNTVKKTVSFVEATSVLLDMISRPYLYPPISRLYIADFSENTDLRWNVKFRDILLNILPYRFQLKTYDKTTFPRSIDNKKTFCAYGMTFISRWIAKNKFTYLGNYLSSDLLRASLYTRMHKSYYEKYENTLKTRKLQITLIERKLYRKMVNADEVKDSITMFLKGRHSYKSIFSEALTPLEQMRMFSTSDIVLATYSDVLVNAIFFEPHSLLVEFMPNGWQDNAYENIVANVDSLYRMLISEYLPLPPICAESGYDSIQCRFAGIRDADIKIAPPKILNILQSYIPIVAKHKYDIIYL